MRPPRLLWTLPALGVALAVPLSGQTLDDRPAGKKYALLIGVREYEHAKLPDLRYTENDVEGLADILRGKPAGFAEVTLLTTTRGKRHSAARPTADNVRSALRRLLGRVRKHDTVLVALAGHGVQLK